MYPKVTIVKLLSLALFSALLLVTTAVYAQEYGTPEEARAMLERTIKQMKADKEQTITQINQGAIKTNDLYPYCIGPDGMFTAHPDPKVRAMSLKNLKDKEDKAFGQELYEKAEEGEVAEVEYMWTRPGEEEPVQKVAYVTKVGDQVCAVGYYDDSDSHDVDTFAHSRETKSYTIPTRVFAGPNQYPPHNYAAYGIIAFTSRATSQTRQRHEMICEAYVSTIPHTQERPLSPTKQMVTVWPINTDESAQDMNKFSFKDAAILCKNAVENYGLVEAIDAIKEAKASELSITGRGPYLLAWSPGNNKGRENAPVLYRNLSNVTNVDQAIYELQMWRDKIEQNPQLWQNGWSLEQFRREIQMFVDKNGKVLYELSDLLINRK